jgi:hypothetical protein
MLWFGLRHWTTRRRSRRESEMIVGGKNELVQDRKSLEEQEGE